MRKFIFCLLTIVILSSCWMSRDFVKPCAAGGGWSKHEFLQIDSIETKYATLIIYQCQRKDAFGNRVCDFRDTFRIIKEYRYYKGN